MNLNQIQRVLELRPDVYQEINYLFNHISYEFGEETALALFIKFMEEKNERI